MRQTVGFRSTPISVKVFQPKHTIKLVMYSKQMVQRRIPQSSVSVDHSDVFAHFLRAYDHALLLIQEKRTPQYVLTCACSQCSGSCSLAFINPSISPIYVTVGCATRRTSWGRSVPAYCT